MAKTSLTNPLGVNQPSPYIRPPKKQLGPVRSLGPMGPMGPNGPVKPTTGPSLSTFAAPAPAQPDYERQFQSALDQTQAGIASQYGSALSDINAREGLANQAVGLLPGQVTDIYGKGAASLAQQTGALDAAQKASGLTSYMGAGAETAPLQAAIAQDQSARLADVPLLQLGTAAQFQGQRGALQQARSQATSSASADAANAAAQRQFQAQQAQQAQQFQTQQALQSRQWGVEDAATANQYGIDSEMRQYAMQQQAAAEQARAAKAEEGRAILSQYAPTDASAERGAALATYVSNRPSKALPGTDLTAYNNALKLMRSGKKDSYKIGPVSAKTINWSKPENVARALEAGGFNTAAALFRHKYVKGGKPATTVSDKK